MKEYNVSYRVDDEYVIDGVIPATEITEEIIIEAEDKEEAKSLFIQWVIDNTNEVEDSVEDSNSVTITYVEEITREVKNARYVVTCVSEI